MKNKIFGKDFLIIFAIIILLIICLLAFFIPNFESLNSPFPFFKKLKPPFFVLILTPILISYFLLSDLKNKEKIFILIFLSMFTCFCVHLHFTNVELGKYLPDKINLLWQKEMHEQILNKNPSAIPHSYRFLAETFISILIICLGDFLKAVIAYRLIFQFLLLFSIFYWARLYVNYRTALITVLLYVLVYPITIRDYAGQPIDPMSHLSFILSFIFLNKKKDFYFILTILIGVLAKESVAVMAIFYFFIRYQKNISHYFLSFLFITLSFGLIILVRWYINQSNLEYVNISGVTPDHILRNLQDSRWYGQVFLTLFLFLPFNILIWKKIPSSLKYLILFLIPILVLTNIIFSWLAEVRNFVPFLIPMCLVSATYFLQEDFSESI